MDASQKAKRTCTPVMDVSKKAKRTCTFRPEFTKLWPCITKSRDSDKAYCTICNGDFSIAHQGKGDVARHIGSKKHTGNAKSLESSSSIKQYTGAVPLKQDVMEAEMKFTSFLVEHNCPLAAADHAGKLFRSMFSSSSHNSPREIINNYACGRTKTTAVVKELARQETHSLISQMKSAPFSIGTDGSNDKSDKLFPIIVRMEKDCQVVTELLSLLELKGRGTGQNIAELIKKDLKDKHISLNNCMAYTSDNVNTMIGKKEGVYGQLLKENDKIISTGCVCHRYHLAAEWASKELPRNVENLFLDIYYYMEKSANRLENFSQLQKECGVQQKKVKKHCPTRWLSLGETCSWVLENWEPLTLFFTEECDEEESEAREIDSEEGPRSRKKNALENLK